jgi:hypothetical protein
MDPGTLDDGAFRAAEGRRRMTRLGLAADYLFKSRLDEYEAILVAAIGAGFTVCPVEASLGEFAANTSRVLVLRHDVDAISPGFEGMLAVEERLGVRSTYYLRWSTYRQTDVDRALAAGHEVSLHYETLSDLATRRGLQHATEIDDAILAECSDELEEEVRRFRSLSGAPCRTLASHGAPWNRSSGMSNAVLFERFPELGRRLGVALEVYEPRYLGEFDLYISDSPWEVNGGYRYGIHPLEAIDRFERISFLTHPNHWRFASPVRCRRVVKCLLRGGVTRSERFHYEHCLRGGTRPPER